MQAPDPLSLLRAGVITHAIKSLTVTAAKLEDRRLKSRESLR
jgi:hypothetical protein